MHFKIQLFTYKFYFQMSLKGFVKSMVLGDICLLIGHHSRMKLLKGKTRLLKRGRIMLKDVYLPNVFWKEVVQTIAYNLNRVKVRVNNSKTPYKI